MQINIGYSYLLVLLVLLPRVLPPNMTQSSVVSAKVSRKLKHELEKSGVNVSEAIRSGLENALRQKKVEQLQELLKGVDLSGLTNEQIVKDIRSGRESRQIRTEKFKRTGSKASSARNG